MCIYLCQVRIHGITFVGAMMSNVASNFAATLAACRFTLLCIFALQEKQCGCLWSRVSMAHVASRYTEACADEQPLRGSDLRVTFVDRFLHAFSHLCRLGGVNFSPVTESSFEGQCPSRFTSCQSRCVEQRMSINPLTRCLSHAHN